MQVEDQFECDSFSAGMAEGNDAFSGNKEKVITFYYPSR